MREFQDGYVSSAPPVTLLHVPRISFIMAGRYVCLYFSFYTQSFLLSVFNQRASERGRREDKLVTWSLRSG